MMGSCRAVFFLGAPKVACGGVTRSEGQRYARATLFFAGLVLGLGTFAGSTPVQAEVPHPRPMAEMNGDCKDYSWDLTQELSLWQSGSATQQESGLEMPLQSGVLYQLQLAPAETVERILPPDDGKARPFDFAGVFSWTPEKDGVYRVSASRKVWLDLLDAQTRQVVPSVSFEMQVQCASIFKSVAFELQAGKALILQVQSSTPRTVDILISPWR